MDTRPSEKLLAQWRAQYEADLDERFGELKRRALEDFDRRFGTGSTSNGEQALGQQIPTDTQQGPTATRRVAVPDTNGSNNTSSDRPAMRQMVLMVLPEPGESFTSRDVRENILHRWPGADTSKHFNSRISHLLKLMLDDGKLESLGKGERIQDPITYRVKRNSGEALLEP